MTVWWCAQMHHLLWVPVAALVFDEQGKLIAISTFKSPGRGAYFTISR